jgi:hypothetical protein
VEDAKVDLIYGTPVALHVPESYSMNHFPVSSCYHSFFAHFAIVDVPF